MKRALPCPAVLMAVAAAALLALCVWLHAAQHERAAARFAGEATAFAARLQAELDASFAELVAYRDALAAQDAPPVPMGFESWADAVLARRPGLRALSWNEWVTSARREAFEAQLRAECGCDIGIHEDGADGRRIPAPLRSAYVVIRYIVPLATNRPALGYNIDAEPLRHAALLAALRRDAPTATGPLRLVQDADAAESSVLVLLPSYLPGLPLQDYERRRAAVRGYVVAVVHVADMLAAARAGWSGTALDVELLDDREPPGRNRLTGPIAAAPLGVPQAEARLDVAGRRWLLRMQPAADSPYTRAGRRALAVLVVGLLSIGLLAAAVLVRWRRNG